MKKQHLITFVLLLLLIPTLVLSPLAAPYTSRPDLQAHAVILADIDTGDILYARNEHERINPASTTKIMTALLAIEALNRGDVNIYDTVTVSEQALADMIPAGASLDLEVGEEMSFESLLYSIMLISANDASNALAEHLSGSIDAFVQLMNDRARELGALNTNFSNTHGLTADNHYTTAYDLFRISQYAISIPRFAELYSQQERAHPATNLRPAGMMVSTNLMTTPGSPYYYPYAFGVKTGFTSAAGLCLVSTATRGDISLLAVVMGVPADAEEANHFTESARLYEWAFSNFEHQEILSTTTEIARVDVVLGDGADSVGLRPAEPVIALVQIGTDVDNLRKDVVIFSEVDGTELQAPINQGAVLGEMTLHHGDRSFGPISLVADESIGLSRVEYMRSELEEVLSSVWVRVVIIVLVLLFVLYIAYAIWHGISKRKRRRERLRRR